MTTKATPASAIVKEAGIGDGSRKEQARSVRERFEARKKEAFKELEEPLMAKIENIAETRAATRKQLEALELRVSAAKKTRKLLDSACNSVNDAGLQSRAEQLDQQLRIVEGVEKRL